MKNTFLTITCLVFTSFALAQYNNRDGNRIGISGGINQSTLMGSNFSTKPGNGFAGGLSVRGNYYDNWSMIDYSLSGVQIKLLLSYNIIKDHVSVDFGPVLQVNGKMSISGADENKTLNGTILKANDIIDVSKINGNAYFGISGGGKVVRALIFYQYGFSNIFGKLNSQDNLTLLNGNQKFKGNIGTISGQIIFNL